MALREIKKMGNKFSGFSLLETTVAVGILVMAIVGPLTLASYSIRSSSVAKNNVIAAGLAQEGIELFRNRRATDILQGINLNGNGWMSTLVDRGCFSVNGCAVDAVTLTITPCGATCPVLNFDSASGLYSYVGTPTPFTRKITASYITENNLDEVQVKSTISWKQLFGDEKFELEEYILNW